jgi:hypothetical protein
MQMVLPEHANYNHGPNTGGKSRNDWTSPRIWRAYCVTSIALLVLVAAGNMLIDPLDIYGSTLFEPWTVNRYERKLDLAEKVEIPPNVLIIGNSRMESFDPDQVKGITGEPCFNWALPAAGTSTYLAVLDLALNQCNFPLDTVIVGIDPVAFHPSGFVHAQARMVPEYAREFGLDPRWSILRQRIFRLLTIDQTGASLLVLRREIVNAGSPPRLEYRADGMANYPFREESILSGEYNLQKVLDERVPVYPEASFGLYEFRELPESSKAEWMRFLDICTKRDIRVYVFILPMHPQLREAMTEAGADSILTQVTDYVKRTVEEQGGTFRDYTGVESCGGSGDDFYDEVPMRPENCRKILDALLKPQP